MRHARFVGAVACPRPIQGDHHSGRPQGYAPTNCPTALRAGFASDELRPRNLPCCHEAPMRRGRLLRAHLALAGGTREKRPRNDTVLRSHVLVACINLSLSNPITGLPSMTNNGRRSRRGSCTINSSNSSSLTLRSANPIFLYAGLFVESTSCAVRWSDFKSERNSSTVNACLKKSRLSYAIFFSARNSCARRQVVQVERG